MHDVPPKLDVIGSPAMPAREFLACHVALARKLVSGNEG